MFGSVRVLVPYELAVATPIRRLRVYWSFGEVARVEHHIAYNALFESCYMR